MRCVHAPSAAVIALVAGMTAAAWGADSQAAHAAPQEAAAEPSNHGIRLDVVVTETGGEAGTGGDIGEQRRTWRVSGMMTTSGESLLVRSEESNVVASASLRDDGRIALRLTVVASRAISFRPPTVAIDASVVVALDDGQPTIVAEASNPANGGVVAVEATATVLDRRAVGRAATSAAPVRIAGGVPVATGAGGDAPPPTGEPAEPAPSPGR